MQVYDHLKSDILMGVFGLGEQLSVEELTDKYDVSRTPVREALNLLHAEGLVDTIPRIGYFTAQPTVKDIQDLFEFRLILESGSARLATARIGQDDLRALEHMEGTYVPGDPSTYLPWIQYNREFHYRIAMAAGNVELAKVIGQVLDRLQRAQWLRLDLPPSPEVVMNRHRQVVRALRQQDAEAAAEAVRADIIASRDAAFDKIAQKPEGWPI
jgi:DNA-binding GntR family transcriptional regulator